jgi:hypothetical protein
MMAHRAGFFRQSNRPNVKIRQRPKSLPGTAQGGGVILFHRAKRTPNPSGEQLPHQHRCDSEGVEQLAAAIVFRAAPMRTSEKAAHPCHSVFANMAAGFFANFLHLPRLLVWMIG